MVGFLVEDVCFVFGFVYVGVSFDVEGNLIVLSKCDVELCYDVEGMLFVGVGMILYLCGCVVGMCVDLEFCVILVIEEMWCIGFVLGIIGGFVVSGEEFFDVDWCEDNDEVWFMVCVFDWLNVLIYCMIFVFVKCCCWEFFVCYFWVIFLLYVILF